jgi:uncharacterized protein
MNTKYREGILKQVKSYYDELDKTDFTHDTNHVIRVENLAKRIATDEGADIEVVEAAALLFDVARGLEDRGEIEDHAEKGMEIARQVLPKVCFPEEKIEKVCHAIYVHRRSTTREPESIEAKILQDADYLDAMGAIDIARALASALCSKKYAKPIYREEPLEGSIDQDYSAIHFIEYQIKHPKHQPENFHTKLGRELAGERFNFMKEYVKRFKDEWHGVL